MKNTRATTTALSIELGKVLKEQGFTNQIRDIDLASEEEYQQVRMDYFGASDSSRLLDVNPFYENPYKELINEKKNKLSDPAIGKKAVVRMGKDLEDIILTKLTELKQFNDTDRILFKPNIMYTKDKYNLSINYDGVLAVTEGDKEDIFLYVEEGKTKYIPTEIKTVSKYGRKYYNYNKAICHQEDGEWQEFKEVAFTENEIKDLKLNTDLKQVAEDYGIPVYYLTQVQQQMMGTNSDYGYLAILDVESWDIYIFKIYKNIPCQIKLNNKIQEAKKDLE